jgi:hypothetical protein
MKLVTLQNYLDNRFASDSRPHPRTIKSLIDDGQIIGKRLGRNYFVEVDNNGREIDMHLKGLYFHG